MELTIIIPAYNEEQSIGRVIDEIRELDLDCQIMVVDNASEDKTAEVTLNRGIIVLHESKRGKGNAVRAVLPHIPTPYIAMLDADFTYPAHFILPMLNTLKRDGLDAVSGWRKVKEPRSMTRANRVGNFLLSLIASLLYSYPTYRSRTRDVCSGLWVFRTSVLQGLPLTSQSFTLEADILVNLAKGQHNWAECPIVYRARLDGSVPKLKVKDGLKIGWFLIRRRFT